MERVEVSREILNVILNYLAKRPYSEVAGLIKALQDDLNQKKEASDESES